MLYVVSAPLSEADVSSGASFTDGFRQCIGNADLTLIEGDDDLTHTPKADDAVVVFNPTNSKAHFRRPVFDFLTAAKQAHADLLAVALSGSSSSTPAPLAGLSPYPVDEIMATYRFHSSQMSDAGRVFARMVRSHLHPTYARERLQLFLSYAHRDGHEIARRVGKEILGLHQLPYRDFADFRNDSVEDRIAAALDDCDVLVFLDTPDATSSNWIKTELCLALSTGIPIVWVRLGQSGRSNLPVRPADYPDIQIDSMPSADDDLHGLARDIVAAAFDRAGTHVRRVENCFRRAQERSKVRTIDVRQRVFELTRDRSVGQYAARPEIHVVQLYGRRPTTADRMSFTTLLESNDYHPHEARRGFDLAAMVSPSPGSSLSNEGPPIVMHGGALVAALTEPVPRHVFIAGRRPELLLFAAFSPMGGTAQPVRDAVQEVTTYWLSKGGRIRFGGHPTVTSTVNYVASNLAPNAERERVTIFQSRYFEDTPVLLQIAQRATLVETDETGRSPQDRAPSLTVMREAMINSSDAVAAVVIGGLTRKDLSDLGRAEMPGVEEEVLLAEARQIPIFVLGHTGGHASVLADQARQTDPPWRDLGNGLSDDDNEHLVRTDDYWRAAEMIWNATASPKEV